MDINPIKLMQLKGKWHNFQNAHPKFMPFLNAASNKMEAGSIFAISITSGDGRVLETNLRLSAEDVDLLREISELTSGMMNH